MQAQQLKKGLLQLFCKKATQKSGFRPESYPAYKHECVFDIVEFLNDSIPNIIIINRIKFANCAIYTLYNSSKSSPIGKPFCKHTYS